MKTGDDFKGIILRKCGGLTKWQSYDTFLLASKSVYIITDQVFGLAHLLGFRFAPRIRDLGTKRMYSIETQASYPGLEPYLGGSINAKQIEAHWDDLLRLTSSVRNFGVAPKPRIAAARTDGTQ